MIDRIRQHLKILVGDNRLDQVFSLLHDKVIHSKSDRYNDLILIQSKHSNHSRAGILGLIDFKDKSVSFNTTNEALLWLIDKIQEEDLHPDLRVKMAGHKSIPEYHAFTCDRFDQREQCQIDALEAPENQKIFLYFLYGDTRQAHKSLYACIGYESCDMLCNPLENIATDKKVAFRKIMPRVSQNKTLFRLSVAKELFAQFYPSIPGNVKFQTGNLQQLLDSPTIKELKPTDNVFVLLTMDVANWNKDLTPDLVEDFIKSYLMVDLPPESPRFFFFFGVEYQKNDPKKREEVAEAIQNRKSGGNTMEELLPVTKNDVTGWFSTYRDTMVGPGLEAKDLTNDHFTDAGPFDMLEVEAKLNELILLFNKGFVLADQLFKNR